MRRATIVGGSLGVGAALVAIVAALAASTTAGLASPGEQASPTLRVVAGQGDGWIVSNEFLPSRLRVAVGTTVVWTVESSEQHTVAFLAGERGPTARNVPQPEDPGGRPPMANPFVWDAVPVRGASYDGTYRINSGPLHRDQSHAITFSTPGTYPFLCTLHADVMTGVVEVVAPGTAGITTQAQADDEIRNHMAREHQDQIAEMLATRDNVYGVSGARDTEVWFVRAGTAWRRGHLGLDRFLPDTLTIRQGDTVVWAKDGYAPHTVTFFPPDEPRPSMYSPGLPDGTLLAPGTPPPADPSVLPRLVLTGARPVRPSPTYDGRSLYSSGTFGIDDPDSRAVVRGPAWSLTFDTPGTFEYWCELHDALGMKGQIIVTPRG
jgi:plastocyanin